MPPLARKWNIQTIQWTFLNHGILEQRSGTPLKRCCENGDAPEFFLSLPFLDRLADTRVIRIWDSGMFCGWGHGELLMLLGPGKDVLVVESSSEQISSNRFISFTYILLHYIVNFSKTSSQIGRWRKAPRPWPPTLPAVLR
jgi:hypothetical protein